MPPSTRPSLSPADAERLVEQHFGLRLRARALPSYSDQNFRMDDAQMPAWVLKVARYDEPTAALELENAALAWIGERVPEIQVPELRPALDGAEIVHLEDEAANRLRLRLIRFLSGGLLVDSRPLTPGMAQALGRSLGRLTRGLQDFDHPAARRVHDWDLLRAPEQRPHLEAVPSAEDRRLVEAVFDLFDESVTPRLGELPRSIVHNDANDHNVLVGRDGDALRFGLIDFGDMLRSATVCELAIAITYAILDEPDPLGLAVELVAGYAAFRPLRRAEREVLLPLVQARLAVSVVRSARQRMREPEVEYLAVSERPAWAMLRHLSDLDAADALERFSEVS